jgi:hypothetical protein
MKWLWKFPCMKVEIKGLISIWILMVLKIRMVLKSRLRRKALARIMDDPEEPENASLGKARVCAAQQYFDKLRSLGAPLSCGQNGGGNRRHLGLLLKGKSLRISWKSLGISGHGFDNRSLSSRSLKYSFFRRVSRKGGRGRVSFSSSSGPDLEHFTN